MSVLFCMRELHPAVPMNGCIFRPVSDESNPPSSRRECPKVIAKPGVRSRAPGFTAGSAALAHICELRPLDYMDSRLQQAPCTTPPLSTGPACHHRPVVMEYGDGIARVSVCRLQDHMHPQGRALEGLSGTAIGAWAAVQEITKHTPVCWPQRELV